eukprot:1911102-Pyramimonas_sp.AAC.1
MGPSLCCACCRAAVAMPSGRCRPEGAGAPTAALSPRRYPPAPPPLSPRARSPVAGSTAPAG